MKKNFYLFLISVLICHGVIHSQNKFTLVICDTVAIRSNIAFEEGGENIFAIVSKRSDVEFAGSEIQSAFILRIGKTGDTTVRRFSFGDTLFSFQNAFRLEKEGYLVSGFGKTQGKDGYMLLLMEIDDGLDLIWWKFYEFQEYYTLTINRIFELPTGIVLAGQAQLFPQAGLTPTFLRMSEEGNIDAQYHYDDSAPPFDFLLSPDSSEIWCLCSYGLDPINGPSLTAFDTSFYYLYSKVIPGYSMYSFDALWYSDTTFLLAYEGQRPGAPYQDDEHYINLYDTSLNLLYSNYFGAPDTSDYPAWRQSVDFRHPDSVFFAGWKNHDWGYPSPNVVSWIMTGQLDSTLQPRYLHFIGGDAYYEANYILATSDGGSLICAGRWDPDKEVFDLLFMKLNREGFIVGTQPPGIEIRQALVYPNPATNWLTVETALRNAKLQVYNTNGNLVLTHQIQGLKERINISQLLSGAYIFNIITKDGYLETGKFIKP